MGRKGEANKLQRELGGIKKVKEGSKGKREGGKMPKAPLKLLQRLTNKTQQADRAIFPPKSGNSQVVNQAGTAETSIRRREKFREL
ncbi:hypothetical protein PoB_004328400 [Plakobranchus ocellatus]|uniref:Small EDRK-rich factor-like N-terminal domain-containing protein n=1 Tax=Plakobranchus ocellatus TaxID=259542 RepID=A0AAV4BDA1_9GAST|nr:hypothetical protein PoB_004328400 [Plakobranchus ocellatus]